MTPPPRFGLPKSRRLLKSAEFLPVRRHGRKRLHPLLILFTRGNPHGTPRLGLTVSRKVGNAVVRNRVKRVVREFFRLQVPADGPPLDHLVVARPEAGGASNPQLREALAWLFGNAGDRPPARDRSHRR